MYKRLTMGTDESNTFLFTFLS